MGACCGNEMNRDHGIEFKPESTPTSMGNQQVKEGVVNFDENTLAGSVMSPESARGP